MKPFFVKLTMAIAIGVLSTAAGAKNLGKFYCGECGLLGQDLETIQQFIQGLGLKDKAGNPYKPQTLDEILICDTVGGTCLDIQLGGFGRLFGRSSSTMAWNFSAIAFSGV
jgi:hypothetical protein